jgi:hypothetical protein
VELAVLEFNQQLPKVVLQFIMQAVAAAAVTQH